MKVLVEADDGELLKDVKADSRGRITLGADYAGETVSIAVIERDSNLANSGKTGAYSDD